jgi:hypothetical protein
MKQQLLAANHFVMGTTNILMIALPDTWRLLDGYAAPEVDRWSECGERRWMSQGRAPYRLIEPHPEHPGLVRAEVELMITATPGAGGHEVRHAFTAARRGLLRRTEVPALHLEVGCPETGRRLRLEFSAAVRDGTPAADRADLERLLEALTTGMACH